MPYSEFTLAGKPFGNNQPLTIIAGPCVIESKDLCLKVGKKLRDICSELNLPYVFKASFDKANRSSAGSFRGLGMREGLKVLAEIKRELGVPVLTDVHESAQAMPVAKVCDVLQVPAFLCRQTDLLVACAQAAEKYGGTVNVKKGQFMAPWDMSNVWDKLGGGRAFITERGVSFGYNNLVVDMRSLLWLKDSGIPACFDASHSVQLPGGAGKSSAGERQYLAGLATAAVSLGIAALFIEIHPRPEKAKSDRETQLPLADARELLTKLAELDRWAKRAHAEDISPV